MSTYANRSAIYVAALCATSLSTPVFADEPTDGDIIVTARRVEERLQDVPISITVFNGEQLQNRNIAIASDLSTYTPSLSVNSGFGPEKTSFAIRGFNQDASTSPTVGVYFADVVGVRAQGGTTSGSTAAPGSFTDLQNVQVLKGPQGTLFGRNTTGGAILLVPQKPTDRLEGFVEGTYGNYDQRRLQAAVNIPLADTFKVRAAVDYNKRDGYLKNRSGVGPSDFNNINYFYGRLSIVADLAPDLENYSVAYYSRSDTNGYAKRVAICDSAYRAANALNAFPIVNGRPAPNTKLATTGAACDQIARRDARGDGLLDVDSYQPDQTTGVVLSQWQVINTTTWRASDSLTVKNIMSYGEFREKAAFSLNGENFFVPAEFGPLAGQRFGFITLDSQPGYDAAAQSTFTEELQLQGDTANGRINYVAGGYLEFSRPLGWNQQRIGAFGNCTDAGTLACSAPLGFVSITQPRNQFDFDNHGVFGQATFKVTETFSVTAGGRYTFDTTVGRSESTRILLANVPGLGVVPARQQCNNTFLYPTVDLVADRSGDLSKCAVTITQNSNRPTWLFDVDYKPTENVMLFAKYSRGYRQGGVNFTNPGLETWGPEKVDAFEIGLKSGFSGAVSGYFNVVGFYNKLRDQQVFALAISGDPLITGGNVIINAGRSEIKGAEVDASATFFDSLRFDVGYAYIDARIKKIASETELQPLLVGTPFVRLVPQSSAGEPLSLAPKHKLTVTGTYTFPIPQDAGRLSISGTYTYTSSQYAANLATSPIGLLPETNLFNANLNWSGVAGLPVDLSLFATNIANKKFPVAIGNTYNSGGFDSYMFGPPRIYGMRLRFEFGQ